MFSGKMCSGKLPLSKTRGRCSGSRSGGGSDTGTGIGGGGGCGGAVLLQLVATLLLSRHLQWDPYP